MNGDSLYRIALARPRDSHARPGSAIVVIIVLALIGAAVAAPMFLP